ncbi:MULTISPECIES: DGQHR domain-containing protein [unclassified Stenotrophomonas maltophilia group]|uniref:DGQHR domain-containing protein n=1 Tax=unclassified Stenotrophomonas maltophilia group TaxID=2961925 RepID=UPI00131F11E5|nr:MULTISPECIES: DGQHR domain-containing protein [unclassified Stenotrophomonas maltophilia group]
MSTEANARTYPCVTYAQPGAVFYACSIPAKDIIYRLEIRRRSADGINGIQREEDPRRISDIKNYLISPSAVLPTPVVVAANSEDISVTDGSLTMLREGGSVGHILDGQHRILGLRNSSPSVIESFDLLLVFVFDIDPYAQATIFSTINSTQKQVSKSLMYDLFSLAPGRSIGKTCHEIVKSLNEDQSSPFFRRIKMLGKRNDDRETLSQAAFVDSVSKLITDQSGIFREYFESNEDWVIRKVVLNAFNAISKAQDNEPTAYPRDYFFKTTGFGGFIQALGQISKQGQDREDLSEKYFYTIMSNFFAHDPRPPAGVGNSAMIEIRKRILHAAGLS